MIKNAHVKEIYNLLARFYLSEACHGGFFSPKQFLWPFHTPKSWLGVSHSKKQKLVGGIPTHLNNMSLHVGWWDSQLNGKIEDVPNHQPGDLVRWCTELEDGDFPSSLKVSYQRLSGHYHKLNNYSHFHSLHPFLKLGFVNSVVYWWDGWNTTKNHRKFLVIMVISISLLIEFHKNTSRGSSPPSTGRWHPSILLAPSVWRGPKGTPFSFMPSWNISHDLAVFDPKKGLIFSKAETIVLHLHM